MLRHLESVIRQLAVVFVSLDGAARLLEVWQAQGALPPSLARPDGSAHLFMVLRGLLAEHVPVADVAAMNRSFQTPPVLNRDVQTSVESARFELARYLPGADGSRQLVELPAGLERAIGRHVRSVEGKRFLAMPRAAADRYGAELFQLLAGRHGGDIALKVRQSTLRPFVRRFTERVVPALAIVSQAELLRAEQREDS
jgi:flagellar biosynthesis component FlhA